MGVGGVGRAEATDEMPDAPLGLATSGVIPKNIGVLGTRVTLGLEQSSMLVLTNTATPKDN